MSSPINLLQPGPKPNATTKQTDNGDQSRRDAASSDKETFQSVMAEKPESDDCQRAQSHDKRSDTASANTDDHGEKIGANVSGADTEDASDDMQEYEIEFTNGDVANGDAMAASLAEYDEIEFVADKPVQKGADNPVGATASEVATEDASTSPSNEKIAVSISRSENGTPAWFAAGPAINAQVNKNKGVDTLANNGAVPSTGLSTIKQDEWAIPDDNILPVNGRNTAPGQTGDAPGQQVKTAVLGAANASSVALANAPGEAPKNIDGNERLSKGRVTAETASETLAPVHKARTVAAQPPVSAPPMHVAPLPNPGLPKVEASAGNNVRWLSEVNFAADVAPSEMPATSRLQQAVLLQQPDLPRNVAIQLAQAMRQGGLERPMELVLSPAELGRVRLSMQAGDGAMTVHVMADRPETLDLLRRHIDILAEEFHEIGYGTAEFAFGQNAPEGDGMSDDKSGDHLVSDAPIAITEDSVPAAQAPLLVQTDRVDIRL